MADGLKIARVRRVVFLGTNAVRYLAALLAIVVLSACAGTQSAYEEPLARAVYQKVNITAYAGSVGEDGSTSATARGTRYQRGSVSSAAADWSRWPAGTLFRVLATGELYEVDDFTDDIVGKNTLLLYKPSVASGPPRYVTIEIIRWGSPGDSALLLKQQRSSTSKKILTELLARYPQRR
jgi:3D (Asp-Asp-Asp) domain-containing protein